MTLVKLVKQPLSLLQIECVKAFGEPAIDRSEQITSLIPLALIAPEPRHAHCGAQFPGLCLLRTRHGASALEINFRFRRIRRRRFKSDFSGNAIDLSLEPGGLRAGAESRRAIALQPVRADPPVVSALDPPMPASVPPPASAPLPVPVPRSQRRLRCSRRLRASRVRLRPLLSRRCSRQHLSRRPPRPRTRNQAVPIGPLFAATRLPAHLYSPARRPATQSRSFRLTASHLAISPHPVAYWAVG
jgi:hypothetical protein